MTGIVVASILSSAVQTGNPVQQIIILTLSQSGALGHETLARKPVFPNRYHILGAKPFNFVRKTVYL